MSEQPAPDSENIPEIQRDRRWKARRWWKRLPPGRESVPSYLMFDRGSLARLRRASQVADVLDEKAVFELHRSLDFKKRRVEETLPAVAVAACILARAKVDDPWRSLATAISPPPGASGQDGLKPLLSEMRLRRLLGARDPDDLLRQMRRTLDLAGEKPLDVGGLAVTIIDWLHPERGDRVRSRFAYDYYAAEFPAPSGAGSASPFA